MDDPAELAARALSAASADEVDPDVLMRASMPAEPDAHQLLHVETIPASPGIDIEAITRAAHAAADAVVDQDEHDDRVMRRSNESVSYDELSNYV